MAGLFSKFFNKKWTFNDIMNVDQGRQQKSSMCSAVFDEVYTELVPETVLDKFKRFFTRNKSIYNVFYVTFKFKVQGDSGHSYDVYIRTQYDPDSVLYMNNTAQVYCGCADFKFHSAWELGQHDSLFLSDRTKLELGPAITNAPKRQSGTTLCKHSYAAVMSFVSNYQGYMMNV